MSNRMSNATLKIRYLPNYRGDPIAYAHLGDAGFDLRAAIDNPIQINFGEITLVPLGVSFEIPEGHEIQLRPRSGLALREGLTLVNAPATIDAGFVGPVTAIITKLKANGEPTIIKPGDRIVQAVLAQFTTARFHIVSELAGAGGFGSTGTA